MLLATVLYLFSIYMFIQPERGYIFWVYKSYKGDKKMSISLLFITAKVEKHGVFSLK